MAVTPILGLYKPVGTDVVDVTAHISDQMATVDGNVGAFVCTSTSRPDPAFAGQIIFVTDIGTVEVFDDVAFDWQTIAFTDERRPRGHMAFGSNNANSELVNNGNSTDVYISLTFNAETGRKYRYIFVVAVDPPDGSGIHDEHGVDLHIRKAEGASVSKTDDFIDFERLHYEDDLSGLAKEGCIIGKEFTLSPAGQWTLGLFLTKFGTNQMQINANYNVLFIEDMGAA